MLFYDMIGIPQLTEENISHIFGSLYIYISGILEYIFFLYIFGILEYIFFIYIFGILELN